jgi:uncharacterized protein (TIGR03067 family)
MRLAAAAIALVLALAAPSAQVRRAPAHLEGVWVATAMEANGKPMPAAIVEGVRFMFKGDRLTMVGLGGPAVEQHATMVVDEKAAPKRLDFTLENGGRTAYAIYEVADNVLKILFVRGGDETSRPASFAAAPGSNQLLIVFKRS